MLLDFFFALRKAKIPTSIGEWLHLMEALDKGLAFASIEQFYELAKLILVKSEKHYDKFDQVFGYYFKGIENIDLSSEDFKIPKDWLLKQLERHFTTEELEKIRSQGDLDRLMALFKKRLQEQKERHEGGNKWIGTGGTSPFGAYGYNPEGFRIEQFESRHRRAIKVWEKRQYKGLDEERQLSSRNLQLALKRLKVIAHDTGREVLDLEGTIKTTAKNAGLLEIRTRYDRHNGVKVLVFFDIGGSMDDFIYLSQRLFYAMKDEFKQLELFYFHNCLYENVWKNSTRREETLLSTQAILRKYSKDYRIIFVGDASMSPYEITYPGGSVEHFNQEAGSVWLTRMVQHFKKLIWLNPVDPRFWELTPSISIIKKLLQGKMYPLTVQGIEQGMKAAL
ncbi:MAG: VWA domain-containing protein [Neisseriaceae bacterium]